MRETRDDVWNLLSCTDEETNDTRERRGGESPSADRGLCVYDTATVAGTESVAFESGSRRAAFPFTTRWGLARGRFTRTRRGDRGERGVRVYLHGVHVSRGDADGESAEGDDEDGEAEEEPDVDTPEWALFVLGRLTLVVLLGLLDSALALALQRAAHRETTLETARCRYGRRNRYPRGWGNRGRGNATRARL